MLGKKEDSRGPAQRFQRGTRTLLETRIMTIHADIHSAHVLRSQVKLNLKVTDRFIQQREFQSKMVFRLVLKKQL